MFDGMHTLFDQPDPNPGTNGSSFSHHPCSLGVGLSERAGFFSSREERLRGWQLRADANGACQSVRSHDATLASCGTASVY